MVNHIAIQLLVGSIFGILSGLGVGGGSLLLLWLTLIAGVEQEQARLINLMFFLPCAVISSFFRWHQGTLKPSEALIPVAAGLAGALLGAKVSLLLDVRQAKKIFGWFFILCGLRELFYRPKK